MKIAILLTVYNRKEKTIQCLQQVCSLDTPSNCSIDIWLTDDGCTDGTPEAISELFPYVNIVKGNGSLFWNRGMWTAWNAASKKYNYDYYLWLNDDTLIYNNCIVYLLEASSIYDNRAIIIGACQSSDKKYTTYGGRDYGMHVPDPKGVLTKVKTFNGNIVLIPSFVYEKLGNLDYHYRHSHGDTDYGYRATEAGISIYQVGKYLGVCDRHESLPKWCNPKFSISVRWKAMFLPTGENPYERFYYDKKHFGLTKAIIHFVLIHIRCIFPSLWIKINHAQI